MNKAKLLCKGSENLLSIEALVTELKGKAPSICFVKTQKGKVFGIFTNVPWGNDNLRYSGNG